jgi:hypothetical protein
MTDTLEIVRKRLALNPFMESTSPLRQTGRTTRMVCEAIAHAVDGGQSLIIFEPPIRRLRSRIVRMAAACGVAQEVHVADSNNAIVAQPSALPAMFWVDHFVLERNPNWLPPWEPNTTTWTTTATRELRNRIARWRSPCTETMIVSIEGSPAGQIPEDQ